MNKDKIILDLCGGTGSWSLPYKEKGYDVRVITLPHYDVRAYKLPAKLPAGIYGILAAPPCTQFSIARQNAKIPRDFNKGLEIVKACLEIIWDARVKHNLKFWALENPTGYLRQFLGIPDFTFEPWQFGDNHSKSTDIWGYFNKPKMLTNIKPKELLTIEQIDKYKKLPAGYLLPGDMSKRAAIRSMTPLGFAWSFYYSNSEEKIKENVILENQLSIF